ncbi:ABC transporter permease [Geothrix alkalitolerans]|uniref:ABC transporter permease n=1 Tax=Geothrix alkalitolerans TaxID=2922724 RepID=UPI001FAE79DB|nr:ABC transporter permease [Geothrix alkalitolerans]
MPWLKQLVRGLVRDPRTSVPAVLLLAIGLGGFVWMLALRRSLMLRSLPVRNPGSLVALWNGQKNRPDRHGTPSYGELELFRTERDLFEGVAATDPKEGNVAGDVPEHVRLERVTANYFQVLGVAPVLGRGFSVEDERPGQDRVVILNHGYWVRRFGGSPDALGRYLDLDGVPHQVVGVLPKAFHTPHGSQLFRPIAASPAQRADFGFHFLRVFARLRPAATFGQAKARMARFASQLGADHPEFASDLAAGAYGYGASPLIEDWLGSGLSVLTALNAAALLLLSLAAFNASALLLARASARRQEWAVRSALGATPQEWRRSVLAEGALLGLGGALLGLLLGHLALGPAGWAIQWGLKDIPLDGLRMDGPAVAATLFLGPALGAVCALASRPGADLGQVIREQGRGQAGGHLDLRRLLVLGQLALAAAMLGTAVWLQGSIGLLLSRDPGFQPRGVWSFRLSPEADTLKDPARFDALQQQLLARLRQLPGVKAVGIFNNVPMSGFRSDLGMSALGSPDRLSPQARGASPGALPALGVRFRRGRDFDEGDVQGHPRVAIFTRGLARTCFGSEDPIGRQVDIFGPATVIGEIDDYLEFGPSQPPPPVFYLPNAQSGPLWYRTFHAILRTDGPPPSEAALRQLTKEVAPGLAIHHFGPLEANMESILGPQRMIRAFFSAFAALALALSVGGVYGLMAASVTERRGELGVRSAMGATAGDLLLLVLHEASRLGLLGAAAGAAAGWLLTRGARVWVVDLPDAGHLLPGLSLLFLILAVLLASLIPALRAARVDPAVALRNE